MNEHLKPRARSTVLSLAWILSLLALSSISGSPGLAPSVRDELKQETSKAAQLSKLSQPSRSPAQRPDKNSRRPNYEVRLGSFNGKVVAYEVIDGWAVIQGDIVIGRAGAMQPGPGVREPASITLAYNNNLWLKVGGVYQIPYVIYTAPGYTPNPNVPIAISQVNSIFSGVIQWIARTAEPDYVNFQFEPTDFSGSGFSSVGRAGGAQQLGGSINQNIPTLLHEMGHATGLWHEQERTDRDTFVTINYNNTEKVSRGNHDILPENSQDVGYYDYASIMHYYWDNLSKNGEPVIVSVPAGIPMGGGDSESYTKGDIDGIKRLYEAVPSAVTITSNPLGLQVVVDGVTITTPQTFSGWALNSTHTLNVPSPQTLGTGSNTRYFTYGRWGDSTVQSHTITVTPGDGNRVTPTNKPAKTVYSAHFIELFKYTTDVFPAGAGTMTVNPLPQSYPGLTGQYFVAGTPITIQANANAGFQFYAWFGNGTPSFSANPQTVKWFYGGDVLDQAGFVPTSSPVYTFNTNPTQKSWVLIDGNFWVGPAKFSPFYYPDHSWDPGTMHSINVDVPEWPIYSQASQTRYIFNNWSDAGAQLHTITLPSGNASYTANFTIQEFVRFLTHSFNNCAGTINVSPPANPDGSYDDGTVLTISQTTSPGWIFTGWSGDLSGTTSPQMLTVNDEVYVEADHNTVAAKMNITSLSPSSATAGSTPMTLTINGTGFTPAFGTAVWINNTFRSNSAFVNSTQMTVPLTAADLSTAGAFQVLVQNNLASSCFNFAVARSFFVRNSNPTAVTLASFNATSYDNGTRLEWQTGFESDNLGFNLYRDQNGKRMLVNSQLVAGSALRAGSTLGAGQRHEFWDNASGNSTSYWVEAVDLKGTSEWYGPFFVQRVTVGNFATASRQGPAASVRDLANDSSQAGPSKPVETSALRSVASVEQDKMHASLASQNAVKIRVKREGLYRVSRAELVASGLDPKADPRSLQLFADGREQPITVAASANAAADGSYVIEYYGIGVDTPSTDERVYWLAAGNQPGLRIPQVKGAGFQSFLTGFTQTVERKDRTIYFSALRNGDKENFFGSVIATAPVSLAMNLPHVDRAASSQSVIEVALQGVTVLPHRVSVDLNGTNLGTISFDGQSEGVAKLLAPRSLLNEGQNVIRFIAQEGPSDISLVDYVRIGYQHTFTADDDALRFTVPAGQRVSIDGFSTPSVRVFDVTDPEAVQELAGEVSMRKSGFSVSVAAQGIGQRALLALENSRSLKPAGLVRNVPSNWRTNTNGADLVIVSTRDFFPSLEPLKALREAQGLRVALVDIEDIYDEFSFGIESPQALKDFLLFASASWSKAPRFVLLAGDATFDPRDYLGSGAGDFVPTRLIDTELMETASDDWFVDFNNDGVPELAIGRLPFRTPTQASTMVSKIVGYERAQPVRSVLLVSDENDGYDFEAASSQTRSAIPRRVAVQMLNRGRVDAATARFQLFDALNSGQKIVNYNGHGSMNVWRGGLLTANDSSELTNGAHLPLFVTMTCLNGYFQDAASDSLAESLMKAERGGAVAVFASSGMTLPGAQMPFTIELYRQLFNSKQETLTLGEATQRAKKVVSDNDVRRTWILFGDPTTRLN